MLAAYTYAFLLATANIDSDFGKIEFQRPGALEPGGQDWLTSV